MISRLDKAMGWDYMECYVSTFVVSHDKRFLSILMYIIGMNGLNGYKIGLDRQIGMYERGEILPMSLSVGGS